MTTHKTSIVAVDGPAGSGKSSICAQVCQKIGWTYVNTGALYRAVALLGAKAGFDLNDEAILVPLIDRFVGHAVWKPQTQELYFEDQNLTRKLDSVEVGNDASKVAKMPMVREKLLPLQRRLGRESLGGALVDGRDIGTVVFPDADLKIFMTASLEERAQRRLNQLMQTRGPTSSMTLQDIMRDIARRDRQDAERGAAPLKQATDAVLFDTSGLNVEQAVSGMIDLLRRHHLLAD